MAGKQLTTAKAAVDRMRAYEPIDAVRLLSGLKTAKFDEAVEVHMRLGVNVRHADQQLRGTIMLPHGTGRAVSVAVFARGTRRGRPRRPALTSSVRRISHSGSRRAGLISTRRSRRPT